MAETFNRAGSHFLRQMRRKWWFVFLFVIWELGKDRIAAWANSQIDQKVGSVMEAVAGVLNYISSTSLAGTISFAVLVVLMLFLHSYWLASRTVRDLFSQLTKDDRYILAIEFKKQHKAAFALVGPSNLGSYGYMSWSAVDQRVTRMVDLGILKVNDQSEYELTEKGVSVLESINENNADLPR